jgi:glycosyltransferase involved in cell wall biosynthesis/polysaccharide pyruvyl transferase WcaK-like protein
MINDRRIAIFIEHMSVGGAERVTLLLANELVKRGYQVDLIARNFNGPFAAMLRPEINQINLTAINKTNIFSIVAFLVGYLRQARPTALLTQLEKPSLLGICASFFAPYNVTIPGVHTDLGSYTNMRHALRRRILKLLIKIFYPHARSITAVSNGAANQIKRFTGVTGPKIEVIYNGLDLDGLRQLAASPVDWNWLKEKKCPVIVSCGRLVEEKGFDTLLHAFALARKIQPIKLMIIGEGPLRDQLLHISRQLGIEQDVSMPGFISNPYACFAKADLFVLASRSEGLSNVLIEALATGVPVVSTDCESGPREILLDGQYGTLVPVDDAPALARAITARLQAKTSIHNKTALTQHLQQFSVHKMVDGYVRLFKSLDTSHATKTIDPVATAILITHAYSRGNQGDGLLVDETLATIRRILPEERRLIVGASNAESFSDLPEVIQVPGVTGSTRIISALRTLLAVVYGTINGHMPYAVYDQLHSKLRMVVAVGGGYLRCGGLIDNLKMLIVHGTQLLWSTQSRLPTIYLPQSIGPLHGISGWLVRRALRKIDTICVRDDRSFKLLCDHPGVIRVPDLAILELFENFDFQDLHPPLNKIYLVARDLPRWPWARRNYITRLQKLRELLPEAEIVTQSAVRSNNDIRFYGQLGWGEKFRTTKEVVDAKDYGVMIAVRLHGSLQAMIGGMPAIHLSYDRKGPGCYRDLGLPDYVHSATNFDPALIARQVRQLQNDPGLFWSRVAVQRPYIQDAAAKMTAAMRRLYAQSAVWPMKRA